MAEKRELWIADAMAEKRELWMWQCLSCSAHGLCVVDEELRDVREHVRNHLREPWRPGFGHHPDKEASAIIYRSEIIEEVKL